MSLPNGLPQISDLGAVLNSTVEAYQLPELVAAPFTTITDMSGNPRKLYDPSKTIRPCLGVERVLVKPLVEAKDERGPNGEAVWKEVESDGRIRGVGRIDSLSSTYGHDPFRILSPGNGYIEVTFYGTGLNALVLGDASSRTWRTTVDGGSSTTVTTNIANVLGARNYSPHIVLPLVSGLALGLHTIKIDTTLNSTEITGFEFLNESTQISIQPGTIYVGGKQYRNNALTTTSYNSGFDGSPTLNGKGGRVVQYITQNGVLGKVLQQTDTSTLYLSAANHTTEEVIKRVNWADFGSGSSNDATVLRNNTNLGDIGFTLEDGTTTLMGNDVSSGVFGIPGVLDFRTGTTIIALTFVGTGLDIVREQDAATTTDTVTTTVDGVSVGTWSTTGFAGKRIEKIASGLPFGTHTVKFTVADTGSNIGIHDFLIYGPKKPSIPTNAQQIQEYYLMATYNSTNAGGSTVADAYKIPTGVIWKSPLRELRHQTGSWAVLDAGIFGSAMYRSGFIASSSTQNDLWEYTFWGTGFVIEGSSNNSGAVTFEVRVNGSLNATGTVLTTGTTNNGGGSYTTATGVTVPVRVQFINLSANPQLHTVQVKKTSSLAISSLAICSGIHIITPVWYPDPNGGGSSLGPMVPLLDDLKNRRKGSMVAKAMVSYNGLDEVMYNSHNVRHVLRISTGIHFVFFKTPFKDMNYIVHGSARGSTNAGAATVDGLQFDILEKSTAWVKIGTAYNTGSSSGNDYDRDCSLFTMSVFGELEDE